MSEIRALVSRLVDSTEALAALGALIRLRVGDVQAHPDVEAALEEVVEALGISDAWDGVDEDTLAPVLPGLLAVFQESLDLVSDPLRAPGWSYTDVRLLESQGAESATFPAALDRTIAPILDSLPERLSRGEARFLDVGVGVAGLSIAMCERWPSLTVVGLDPWAPALELARRNVVAAKLSERITLRSQRVEELDDVEAFDLAWLPAAFFSAEVMPLALGRVASALRDGGWLLLAMYRGEGALGAALARLRTVRSGGMALTTSGAESMLEAAGLGNVRTLPAESWAPAALVAAQSV
ncbi:MAG: SAM-dependent methyltransferase [Gaiellales bacterium]